MKLKTFTVARIYCFGQILRVSEGHPPPTAVCAGQQLHQKR
eukprot:COSAG02_NODE_66470_length_255_cov_0.666667_1_plen_40_part_10